MITDQQQTKKNVATKPICVKFTPAHNDLQSATPLTRSENCHHDSTIIISTSLNNRPERGLGIPTFCQSTLQTDVELADLYWQSQTPAFKYVRTPKSCFGAKIEEILSLIFIFFASILRRN